MLRVDNADVRATVGCFEHDVARQHERDGWVELERRLREHGLQAPRILSGGRSTPSFACKVRGDVDLGEDTEPFDGECFADDFAGVFE